MMRDLIFLILASILILAMQKIREFLAELLETVLISLVIIVPVRFFIIQPFFVKGQSMEPNFHENDYLIVDELSYRFRQPQRGEVVVLKSQTLQNQNLIKRIVGLPNETVDIENGIVSICQQTTCTRLREPYLSPEQITDGKIRMTLGPNDFFVLGDNRQFSYDSRRWGVLSRSDMIGRVWVRLWPMGNATVFAAPSYVQP